MKNRLIGIAAAVVILASATCAMAQDWPQWRGMNRDGKAAKFAAPKVWPKELTQVWKVTVGSVAGAADATPVLVGKRIYVFTRQGGDEVTLCLDAATGKEVWKTGYPAMTITGPARDHGGPRGTPAIANGKMVTLGVDGLVRCVDISDGKELWRNTEYQGSQPVFYTSMSPIIADKMAIFHLGGKDNGTIVAFDLATGAIKWKTPTDGPSYSSPVLMTVGKVKQLVFLTDKNLIGVAVADGKILWTLPAVTERRFYNSSTPIVDGQTVIYTGQGRGTRALTVAKQGDAFVTREVWDNPDLGCGYCSPVLRYGFIYGLSDKGSFFCMNAATGQTVWVDTATRKESYGGIVDAGAVIFGLPSDSQLVVFRPIEKEYKEEARFKVSDAPTYASFIVSGNRIITKDAESVTLWTVR